MAQKVTVDGQSRFLDDLTLDETVQCEEEVGESWANANPLRSAKWARAIMTRFLARTTGEAEAAKKIGALSLKETFTCIENVDDDDRPVEHMDGVPVVDPKAAGADSATTG